MDNLTAQCGNLITIKQRILTMYIIQQPADIGWRIIFHRIILATFQPCYP